MSKSQCLIDSKSSISGSQYWLPAKTQSTLLFDELVASWDDEARWPVRCWHTACRSSRERLCPQQHLKLKPSQVRMNQMRPPQDLGQGIDTADRASHGRTSSSGAGFGLCPLSSTSPCARGLTVTLVTSPIKVHSVLAFIISALF